MTTGLETMGMMMMMMMMMMTEMMEMMRDDDDDETRTDDECERARDGNDRLPMNSCERR